MGRWGHSSPRRRRRAPQCLVVIALLQSPQVMRRVRRSHQPSPPASRRLLQMVQVVSYRKVMRYDLPFARRRVAGCGWPVAWLETAGFACGFAWATDDGDTASVVGADRGGA